MTKAERKASEAALWILYGVDVSEDWGARDVDRWYELVHEREPEVIDHWGQVEELVRGVLANRESLDAEIQAVSPRWKLSRMGVVDRNLLRLGAWQLLHSEVPPLAAINLCIELGKIYGGEKTPAFVNGLLDQLCTEHGIALG